MAKAQYRIISDPSWQVQSRHKGKWVTAYYCASEESAKRCKADCEKRAIEWAAMSPDEQMKSILR